MKAGQPRVVLGNGSKLIGQICPICKKYFLFGDALRLVSRKGIYIHDNCTRKPRNKGGKDA